MLNAKPLPRFSHDREKNHLREIQKKVHAEINLKANSLDYLFVKLKVILFPILYVALYFLTLTTFSNLPLYYLGYCTMGIFIVIIFLNSIHELSHEVVFENKMTNRLFLYFFDVLGANSFIWKQRHQLMHHNYPNIQGWDTDVEQSNMFKIYPDAPHTKFHNIQHYLMFLLYPLYLFNWLLIRDFKDFFKKDSTIKKAIEIPTIEYVKLFAFKLFYVFYMFVVPVYFFKIPFIFAFTAFILHTFVTSVFALLVLLPPHANLENEFPKVDNMQIPVSWLDHQLMTTIDISTHNWFISFFMGNFNYHVAHHIMPSVSYSKMGIATQVIEDYAREHQLPYKKCTLWEALVSHYKLVKRNSIKPTTIFDEIF